MNDYLDYIQLHKGNIRPDELLDYVSRHNINEGIGYDTLIHTVCSSVLCYTDAIEKLLERGADINAEGEMCQTPLHVFCRNTYYPMQYATIPYYEREDLMDDSICGWVENSIFNSRSPLLKKTPQILVDHGADIEAVDYYGRNALFGCYDKNMIVYLLRKGLDINSRDNFGCTPLFLCNDEEIIKYLIEWGADFTIQDDYGRYAVEYNRSEYLKELNQINGIVIEENRTGYAGGTYMAVKNVQNKQKTKEYVDQVRATGTIYFNDDWMGNVTCYATLDGLKILYESGNDLSEKDEEGSNLLTVYCDAYCGSNTYRDEKEQVIRWLLDIGLKLPYDYCLYEYSDLQAIQFMDSIGVDLSNRDEDGCTVLDYALGRDNQEDVVEYLTSRKVRCKMEDVNTYMIVGSLDYFYKNSLVKHGYLPEEALKSGYEKELKKNFFDRFSGDREYEDESGRRGWIDEFGRAHKDYIDEDDQYNDPDYWS